MSAQVAPQSQSAVVAAFDDTAVNPVENSSATAKRVLDIVAALLVAALFAPIALGCALGVALNGGKVLFSQPRVGRGGRLFRIYKFRTMVPDAAVVLTEILATDEALRAEYARDHKLKNDPRVTAIGRFLRRTSFDELPQLINVLRGEMSMVGPRPVEPFEMLRYGRRARSYTALRPGLTGLWQVSGRNDVAFSRRVAMDVYYARRHHLGMDLWIMLKTARVILLGSGAS